MEDDQYKTISGPVENVLFKDRNSKFIGFAYPVESEHEISLLLEKLKKQHPKANHHCYAYQLGKDGSIYRANDDGEPSNSAGQPILGQIRSKELTNVLVVIVRYFGGTKLGVGGLISAYRNCARLSLEEARITVKTSSRTLRLNFDYQQMNAVMRVVKEEQLEVAEQRLTESCVLILKVRLKEFERISKVLGSKQGIEVSDQDS